MTDETTPPVGNLDEVYQDDATQILPAIVGVRVNGAVETHEVPSISGGMRSFTMAAADSPKRVGNDDPRRRVVRMIGDQAFWVGTDANSVSTRYCAKWPAGSVLTITHSEALYVQMAVDGTLSVITENWAS
jgi:hypothetical protein